MAGRMTFTVGMLGCAAVLAVLFTGFAAMAAAAMLAVGAFVLRDA